MLRIYFKKLDNEQFQMTMTKLHTTLTPPPSLHWQPQKCHFVKNHGLGLFRKFGLKRLAENYAE